VVDRGTTAEEQLQAALDAGEATAAVRPLAGQRGAGAARALL
jgi:hypothetical protein